MDRTEDQEEFDAWLQENWGGSDPFSFLMRATWSKEYHEDWGVSGLTAIEERGHLLARERLPIDDEIDRIRRSGSKLAAKSINNFRTLGWRTSMAPYLYVRLLLHHTVGIASSRPPRDKKERSADLSKILQNLRAARSAVHTCLEIVKHRGFPTGESGLPWEERTGRKSKVLDAEESMAASLSAMDFIIEGIEADLARLGVSACVQIRELAAPNLFQAVHRAGLPMQRSENRRNRHLSWFGRAVCELMPASQAQGPRRTKLSIRPLDGDCPTVQQAQEHGPGMAQGWSIPDRQEPPGPCPWASLGGLS